MSRELQVDYAGNSFRWFETKELLRMDAENLPDFLSENIENHFKVPKDFQVLCDVEGPLSTSSFFELLRTSSPRLWLFDARYIGEALRAKCDHAKGDGSQLSGYATRRPEHKDLSEDTPLQMLQAEEQMLLRSVHEALARLQRSPSEVTTAASQAASEKTPVSSGPLPPLQAQVVQEPHEGEDVRQELLAWRGRCQALEEETQKRHTELGEATLRYKLELEVAMRHKEVQQMSEWKEMREEQHQMELKQQAEILSLRHRCEALTEQEEWQQVELMISQSQHQQVWRQQEQEVQELASNIEMERLGSELRSSQQLGAERRASRQLQEVSARLAARDLEALALEQQLEAPKEELRLARAEFAAEAAAAAAAKATQRATEEETAQLQQMLQEEKAQTAELRSELQQLRAAAAAPPAPATPPRRSDYLATADEELDQKLEKELTELGLGVLKGGVLERTGPKKYKMGEKKIFMQLSEGKVTVRSGGGYVPLAQWTRELTVESDDPFSSMQSPFAAVRA